MLPVLNGRLHRAGGTHRHRPERPDQPGERASSGRTTSIPTCRPAIRSPSTSGRWSARAASPSICRRHRQGHRHRTAARRAGRRQIAARPAPALHPDRSQPRRRGADGDRLQAGHPLARGGRRLPAQAALDHALSRHLRRQHGAGLDALRHQRLGAADGREPLRTRAEVKNVNSVRFVMQAIEHEAERRSRSTRAAGKVVQETRLYDSGPRRNPLDAGEGIRPRLSLLPRSRPAAAGLGRDSIERSARTLPELPDQRKERFIASTG